MHLIYYPKKDVLISPSFIYTHEELDALDFLYQKTTKQSLYDLMETYPQAVPLMKRQERKKLTDIKLKLEYIDVDRRGANGVTLGFLDGIQELLESELQETTRNIFILSPKKKSDSPNEITQEDIVRARNVPVRQFLKPNVANKVKCLFHDDNEASMHLYKTNYYCFSCQAHGTAIDLIMRLKNVGFKAAVAFLVGK